MENRDILQCDKSLDFGPRAGWPERLPAYAWPEGGRFYLLCGFEKKSGGAFALEGDLSSILKDIYQTLSLPELARLQVACDKHLKRHVDLSPLAGYRLPADWPALAKKISQTPREFQDWLSDKNVSPRELAFLKLVEAPSVTPLFDAILKNNSSKSQGLMNLERACELYGMGHALERILSRAADGEAWARDLFALRNPTTATRDADRETRLKQLPWPAHTQIRWVRQGDQSGIEVRFHIFSEKDLDRQIHGLDVVRQSMTESPWKTN
jgi:hypothetical protein